MTSVTYTATKGLKLLGDEKGAWLTDTTEETITGSELVTNGDFATDTDWAKGAGWTIASGVASNSGSISALQTISSIPITPGKTYICKLEITAYTSGNLRFSNSTGITAGSNPNYNAAGTYFITITPTASDVLEIYSAAFVGSIDNVSVRLADPDLSTSNNGLGVYGSITKSAVAPGSGLVAYSGFSASNYLEQPYNADLDFGTGDFCVMGWVKPSSVSGAYDNFIELGGPSSINTYADSGFYIATGADPSVWYVATHITGAASELSAGSWTTDEWHFVVMVKSSGNLYSYLDGALTASKVSTQDITLVGTETLMIGRRHSTSNPNWSAASQALFRVLNYAPTAAQIKAIYESEKHLFKKNRMYTQAGEEYSLDFDSVSVLTRGGNTVGKVRLSIDGTREFLKQRDEVMWDVTTGIVDRDNFDQTRRFLESVSSGAQFTFDPYGTIASPDEPRTCTLESNSHQEQTTGPRHISTSFKVREL